MKNSNFIKQQLLTNFDIVGIIKYETYLKYMGHKDDLIENKNIQSLIVCGKKYSKYDLKDEFTFASYCYNGDYHKLLKDCFINSNTEYSVNDFYVDVDNLNEKICGYLAGLGFIGKNQLLINKRYGSYFNIGVLRVKDNFDFYDQIDYSYSCLNCNMCLNNCPTKALNENGYNIKLCKSYLTQYGKHELNNYMTDNVLIGCDICMNSCPYNLKVETIKCLDNNLYDRINLAYLLKVSNRKFKKDFANSPINFIHKEQLLKNVLLLKKDLINLDQNYYYIKKIIFESNSEYIKTIAHYFKKEKED